jgi:hypothetical protein
MKGDYKNPMGGITINGERRLNAFPLKSGIGKGIHLCCSLHSHSSQVNQIQDKMTAS